jgi:cell division protein FtsA
MDTRIGYPNEHLAGNSDEEISSPLYATAVGLVMNSIENQTQSAIKIDAIPIQNTVPKPPVFQAPEVEEVKNEVVADSKKEVSTGEKISRSFFEKYVDRIKDFLDNAE